MLVQNRIATSIALLLTMGALACASGDGLSGGDGTSTGTTGTGTSTGDGDDDGLGSGIGTGTTTGSTDGLPPAEIFYTMPEGFTSLPLPLNPEWGCAGQACAAAQGGVQLIGPVETFEVETATNSCANVLRGIVRDFEIGNGFSGDADGADGINAGLVNVMLGENRKPVPSGLANQPTYAPMLENWFVNSAGGNIPYVVDFWLQPQGETGVFIFDSSRFFPLESVGTKSGNDDDNTQRNFLFTTEIHTKFEYKGGEIFTFRGDDDVFVFIDGQLVVDLGGVHSAFASTIYLDTLSNTAGTAIPLVEGEVYTLDLFHAERNPTGSNFRIETSLDFKFCSVLEDDLVVVK